MGKKATVGRMVWFYLNRDQEQPWHGQIIKGDEGDGTSNVYVIGPRGSVEVHYDVPQRGPDVDYPCWDWMPYQAEQHAKQEEEVAAKAQNLKSLGQQAKAEESKHGVDKTNTATITKDVPIQDKAATKEEADKARKDEAKKLEPGASPVIADDKSKHPNPNQDPMRPKT